MKRILLAFGDSHTAGAEIDEQYSPKCYDRAYPAYIANHYKFDYENFAACGGSNDWMIRQFMLRIQKALIKNESVFVLCNFCDPSRTYIKLPTKLQHCTSTSLITTDNERLKTDPDFIPYYKNYLKTNSEGFLNFKAISHIFIIQSICEQYNIPYVFHISTHWYVGNWHLINKKNFFGHHDVKTNVYIPSDVYPMNASYSYWGIATHHNDWKNARKEERWFNHYPEEYHRFWAQILIDFIDKQGILDTAN
jgi:hypothetical protein